MTSKVPIETSADGGNIGVKPILMRKIRHTLVSLAITLLAGLAQAASLPRGHLVIIGGGATPPSIRRTMVDLAGGTNAVLLAITTAGGETGAKAGESFVKTFSAMGVSTVKWAQPTRAQSDDPTYVESLLKGVTGIFFTGGSQRLIVAEHRGTLLHGKLQEMYENGALISGSSAGAAMMSDPMITGTAKGKALPPPNKNGTFGSDTFNAIAKNLVDTIGGMGFIKGAIIDQHFIKRKRENRLFSTALDHPEYTCFGIDESTALVVSQGYRIRVQGNSSVMVIEPAPRSVKTNNRGDFGARNMKVSLLLDGDTYELKPQQQ